MHDRPIAGPVVLPDDRDIFPQLRVDLVNKCFLHECSSYCLRSYGGQEERCRFLRCRAPVPNSKDGRLYGSVAPHKNFKVEVDRGGRLLCSMPRDHPCMVQHNVLFAHAWQVCCILVSVVLIANTFLCFRALTLHDVSQANCDFTVIASTSDPVNPRSDDTRRVIKYMAR